MCQCQSIKHTSRVCCLQISMLACKVHISLPAVWVTTIWYLHENTIITWSQLFHRLNKSPQCLIWPLTNSPMSKAAKLSHLISLFMSRVSGQNGVSLLYIMLEIHHSGWEPSISFLHHTLTASPSPPQTTIGLRDYQHGLQNCYILHTCSRPMLLWPALKVDTCKTECD